MSQSVKGKFSYLFMLIGFVPILFFGLIMFYALMDVNVSTALAKSPHITYIATITLLASIIAILLISYHLSERIGSIIHHLNMAIHKISKGDTSVEMIYLERDDELSQISQNLVLIQHKLDKASQNAILYSEHHDIEEASLEELENIHKTSNSFLDKMHVLNIQIAKLFAELDKTTHVVHKNYTENSQQSKRISNYATTTQDNINQIASAVAEFSTSIQEIAMQISKSTKIAAKAVEEAEKGNQTMQDLSLAATKIDGVTKLINEITEKINLLSLNATIEAARAGEAGKGFAVVASEVKNLANQTAKATAQISSHISSIQSETQNAVSIIKDIGLIINTMDEFSNAIASAVEQQGAASKEIAKNIQEAAESSRDVGESLLNNTLLVQESEEETKKLYQIVKNIQHHFDGMKQQVDHFLKQMI